MANEKTSTTNVPQTNACKVHGTVRDVYQRPLSNVTVRIFSQGLRSRQALGDTLTAADGTYSLVYKPADAGTTAIFAGLYDAKGKTLLETKPQHTAPADWTLDLDLSGRPYAGIAAYDRLLGVVAPFMHEVPLEKLTETTDIPFIAGKTGLAASVVGQLVMAAKYATYSSISVDVWYALLAQTAPGSEMDVLDRLMHLPVDTLMGYLRRSIDQNIVSYSLTADLAKIETDLQSQQAAYGQKHPVTGAPSVTAQLAAIAGNKNTDTLEAVSQVAHLTGNHVALTQSLVKAQKIGSPADVRKLAGNSRAEWVDLLKKNKITPGADVPGATDDERLQNYAAQLDANLTQAFPSASFAARLGKDKTSRIPHRDKVNAFLQKNPDFDLVRHPVGSFIQNNKDAVPAKDAADVTEGVRRIQRMMKIAPHYDHSSVLLDHDIHSAQQIVRMGEAPFVQQFGDALGQPQATQVFQQASQVQAATMALTGNLRSMADASTIKAFPNFAATLATQLGSDLPNLETLFGHTDYCACDECSSVYGAPAYLTELLHFLAQRKAQQPGSATTPSVKDLLLQRRPDIGDIDLNCDNTNVSIPYIDVACELMEDFIAPPVITIPSGTIVLTPGTKVDANALLTAIRNGYISTAQNATAALLTAAATVSVPFSVNVLQTDGTPAARNRLIVRDSRIVLRVEAAAGNTFEVRQLHQTLQPADAIAAEPEYVNLKAYDALKAAKKPFALPFDLYEHQAELYLQKLGISKADLFDVFRQEDHIPAGQDGSDFQMGYASLGITAVEQKLIFLPDAGNQSQYWGDVASATAIPVNTFESLTGLNYQQILDLIQVSFVNPARDTVIQHDDLTNDLSKQRLTNITPAKLDAIHRFLRLWRKTSFSMSELDALIMAASIGNGAIAFGKLALSLQQVKTLGQQLGLNVWQLLSLYQNISTTYNDLFQNTAITSPVNPNFALPVVQGGALPVGDPDKPFLSAILQLSLADVQTLLDAKTDGKLSLDTLSTLYRHALLARSLQLSVNDLLTLLLLTDANPFQEPEGTVLFQQKYRTLQTSGFSIDELNYILRHQDNASQTLIPGDDEVALALSSLGADLQAVDQATQVTPDPSGVLLSRWLGDSLLNWDAGLAARLIDLLNTPDDDAYAQKLSDNTNFLLDLRKVYHEAALTADLAALPLAGPITPTTPPVPIVFPASLSMQISYDPVKKQLRWAGYMSAADKTALQALSPDPNYFLAVNTLFTAAQQTSSAPENVFFASAADITNSLGSVPGTDKEDRFGQLLLLLHPAYLTALQNKTLIGDLSTLFKVDQKAIRQLLVSQPTLLNDLIGGPAQQASRYQSLAKICFIITRLKLTDVDLAYILANAAATNILDLNTLPLEEVDGPVAATVYPAFESLIGLLQLQQQYPAKVIDVVSNTTLSMYTILQGVIDQGAVPPNMLPGFTATIAGLLSELTGWNNEDLIALIGLAMLSLPADILSVPVLLRLQQRIVTQRRLGVSVADAYLWAKGTFTADIVSRIKQLLKSKYSAPDWLTVSQSIQDNLREKRRDALIAYLLANPGNNGWKTADDLYGYFLLDVQMCSCQPTSRIVQATNSVQLFVQRGYLELEGGIKIDSTLDPAWKQWQWMSQFRLWQANVKTFLYPENYIEPDLLPESIKSSFLTELESDLLQNEATADNVAIAYMNYLQKLSGIARLEIVGQYYDELSNMLHVIGRTFGGEPKEHYYRTFSGGLRWSPWEKISLDIDTPYVMPVAYKNHVYLFWAQIKSSSDTTGKKQWQVQLAYSEYIHGAWTPKKTSGDDPAGQLVCDQVTHPVLSQFFFATWDVPQPDLASLYDSTGHWIGGPAGAAPKIKAAVLQNGVLVISCYYYDNQVTSTNPADYNKFIGSFQLDISKGYPVAVPVPITVTVTSQQSSLIIRPNLVNNFDVEPTDPVAQPVPGINALLPNQARGRFNVHFPIQMDIQGKITFLNFLSADSWNPLLGQRPNPFVASAGSSFRMPFFYQDQRRTYYVEPRLTDFKTQDWSLKDFSKFYLDALDQGVILPILSVPAGVRVFNRFYNFQHPMVAFFQQKLFEGGIDGLMDRATQLKGDVVYDTGTDKFDFSTYYNDIKGGGIMNVYTGGTGNPAFPHEDVDFTLGSGYGMYNWELFFHAPLMIAERLSQNQQFDDADRWYRYIFNPLDSSSYPAPNKFWNTKPFFETTSQDYLSERIDQVLQGINQAAPNSGSPLLSQVADWRNNPFQPHFIAQTRTVAYQKVAVMKYVGHLIRYGDYLFQQDTMESVNRATQLYILASEILGPKPEVLPSIARTGIDNYSQLEQKLDAMSDAMVNVENLLPMQTVTGYNGTTPTNGLPPLQTLYFCIPMNENMAGPTGFWDVITDRLFKIRHCLNIDGTLAPLSLFAPAINPALLVRAAAAGLDLGSVLTDLNAPLPFYRFATMLQKAMELCNDVRGLGSLLLSVLEKKDAESLNLLRSGQEIKVQNSMLVLKQRQVDEAGSALSNLLIQKQLTTVRQQYYSGLLRGGLSGWEKGAMTLNASSIALDIVIVASYFTGSVAAVAPNVTAGTIAAGTTTGPYVSTTEGGSNAGESAANMGRNLGAISAGLEKIAAMTNTNAVYNRRSQEWQYQLDLATKELELLDQQIAGAKIRVDITNQDVRNQQLLIDNAGETDGFMRSKYTNEDLFSWMITQVSTTYFKSYQLAYDVARKAEHCFRYELGLADSSYINFGYWDNLKKGLLAGEQLGFDLKNLEMAYFEQNKRELELTKTISLALLDPVALTKLKTNRECWINLPEELFDMDYPGHYMRRIKSVSITIPCVAGPYTTVSCKLTLTNNSIRTSSVSTSDAQQYPRKTVAGSPAPADDLRFRDNVGALQSIATSMAQNDAGLFELNFRDERYLPFEGAGAISLWHLELPAAMEQFDYDSIADVILHVRYTARDGGDVLRANATDSLNQRINQMLVSTKDKGLMRIFSAKNDLATEWYRFLHPALVTDDQVLNLSLDKGRFPLFAREKKIQITSIELAADTAVASGSLQVMAPGATSPADTLNLQPGGVYGSWLNGSVDYSAAPKDPGAWVIRNPVASPRMTDADWNNIVVIVRYTIA